MLLLTFDHHVLSSLPPMDSSLEGRVLTVLRAIVDRRVLPYFASLEGVDTVQLARASERYQIERFDDPRGDVEIVSFTSTDGSRWTLNLHEQIFDYIAFALPANPLQAFQPPTDEAAKVMALAEFILRHELDHIVRPGRSQGDVAIADCEFLDACRTDQPEYFTTLEEAFADATNGLLPDAYRSLLEAHDSGDDPRAVAEKCATDRIVLLCALPSDLLSDVFMVLSESDRERLLSACYGKVGDRSLTVAQRARHLDGVLGLLDRQRRDDLNGLRPLFEKFATAERRDHVLRNLELDGEELDPADDDSVYEALIRRLAGRSAPAAPAAPPETQLAPALEGPHLSGEYPEPDSLKQRIEVARQDPRVPQAVKRAIDNNASNISSHSSAKYTEFIETLLAIPWGTIQPIDVGPREFAAGLDAGHFGLAAPKELIADFFANLIWRYREFDEATAGDWNRTGSAFLFVGPPGVGKTSLAISIASNLGLPYHKISLGGLRDESALRGHGFTYEGSKPGAIVQGLIKMKSMNGLFILDEADKTESMTVATLLEILDPEQNHLFHDKYTLSTVDIDLSNCHFILTANTLDTVPAPVIDRCQVVHLDRYSMEEKVEIARRFILPRLRERHDIGPDVIDFETDHENEHLRYVIRAYTNEAGVRQLELALRKLLLRLQRRHVFEARESHVDITHRLIKETLEAPAPPTTINGDDRIGEMLALGVNPELGIGSVIPVQATRIAGPGGADSSSVSMVHATGNLEKVMDESRRVATTAILHCADRLGFDPQAVDVPVHLHFLGASTKKDGPSAGAAIALALASLLSGTTLRRDVAATGEVDTQGRITGVGGIDAKIETAVSAGCRTVLIPAANREGPGGLDRLPDALRRELLIVDFDIWRAGSEPFDPERHAIQVVMVDHITQALEVAALPTASITELEAACVEHARGLAPLVRDRQTCPLALLVKEPDELDDPALAQGLCEHCSGCRLLVPKGTGGELPVADGGRRVERLLEIEPGPEALAEAIRKAAAEDEPRVVVAPYFALRELDLGGVSAGRPITFFANNWLAQGFKLKDIKRALNRAICRLQHFGRAAVDTFPLLTERNGVFVADLSRLPESLRLDPGRCEELLNRFLDAWVAAADEVLKPHRGATTRKA